MTSERNLFDFVSSVPLSCVIILQNPNLWIYYAHFCRAIFGNLAIGLNFKVCKWTERSYLTESDQSAISTCYFSTPTPGTRDAVTNLPEAKSPAFARRNLESMMGEGAGGGEEEGDREVVGE